MAAKDPLSERLDEQLRSLIRPKAKRDVLLVELDDLLLNRPSVVEVFDGQENALGWIGRVNAAIGHWDSPRGGAILMLADRELSGGADSAARGYNRLLALLSEASHSIRLESAESMNVGVQKGAVHDYFDGLRKIVGRATTELFFADTFLDADFVSRYMPFVHQGVSVRLLAGKTRELATLLPAVDAFAKEHGLVILVRSRPKEHQDRFVFVDGKECFQSGASFKDGGKQPTTLTQITDAFAAMWQAYEQEWQAAKVER